MKRVRVNVGKIGVVTSKGDYKRVLTAGSYWIGFYEELVTYDMSKMYTSGFDLNIMMQDEKFAELVTVLNVKDNEMAIKFENGIFKSILNAGRYLYFEGLMDFDFKIINTESTDEITSIDQAILQNVLVSKYIRSYQVKSYEQGLLFIDGKFVKKLDKGSYYFWKNATSIEVLTIDKRQLQLEISGQEMLTKDKAALRMNFYAQYKVIDIEKALVDNKDYEKQLYILIQLALRAYVGTQTLDELLDKKEEVSKFVSTSIKESSKSLGVMVANCGVRDIILPGDVKDIMNKVLIAQKQAQANTIMRREETASTRSLLNTAKLMEENEMLMKLKELEYIEKIADRVGEITVSGGGKVLDQLKEVFSNSK